MTASVLGMRLSHGLEIQAFERLDEYSEIALAELHLFQRPAFGLFHQAQHEKEREKRK